MDLLKCYQSKLCIRCLRKLIYLHEEHVTKYIYDNHTKFNICTLVLELSFPNLKFDVDKMDDLKTKSFIKKL